MGELAAPVDPWPGAPIIIDTRYSRALSLIERGNIMTHTTPPPRPSYPHDGMLTQPPRKQRIWPWLLIAPALFLLCGGLLTAIGSAMENDTELRPGRSAVEVVTPSPTPTPPTR